jgi:hypothetical protein
MPCQCGSHGLAERDASSGCGCATDPEGSCECGTAPQASDTERSLERIVMELDMRVRRLEGDLAHK